MVTDHGQVSYNFQASFNFYETLFIQLCVPKTDCVLFGWSGCIWMAASFTSQHGANLIGDDSKEYTDSRIKRYTPSLSYCAENLRFPMYRWLQAFFSVARSISSETKAIYHAARFTAVHSVRRSAYISSEEDRSISKSRGFLAGGLSLPPA
ncbi:Uncharacterized protein DBV15_06003 [Temnothorax longispinosus]|uniref:Uncharacterized protein n=1 Tax=Temnothorax longispinosus TaxID=300112 RepID=A0A4S2KHS6_9HYME|nr:Uncharacterized protein DBV15_06003 [Temnothorax longispinosus]